MRVISRENVMQTLSLSQCMALSREAFLLVSQGKVRQTLRSIIAADDGSLMGTMPACITEGPYAGFGLKSVKVDFSHRDQATSHEGAILLYGDDGPGEMALVDAGAITELRTAAASALATDLLAPKDAHHLAILGTGVQARQHARMIAAIRPLTHITVWGRTPANAAAFAAWCREHLRVACEVADSVPQAVKEADIICTVTAATSAFLHARDLPARCHINAPGASAAGFEELAPDVYAQVDWFVDSRDAVTDAARCLRKARELGLLAADCVGTEIGELLMPNARERMPQAKRTLFRSVGVAAQDLVFARAVVARLAG